MTEAKNIAWVAVDGFGSAMGVGESVEDAKDDARKRGCERDLNYQRLPEIKPAQSGYKLEMDVGMSTSGYHLGSHWEDAATGSRVDRMPPGRYRRGSDGVYRSPPEAPRTIYPDMVVGEDGDPANAAFVTD